MKKILKKILFFCVAAHGVFLFAEIQRGVSPSKLSGGSVPKALVIMLDGVRSDALEVAHTPAIRSLLNGTWQRGYKCSYTLSALTIPDAPSSSASNHAAIAMGVAAAKSKVFNNGPYIRKGDYSNWPSWMARIAAARAGSKTAFYYSWPDDGFLCPTSSVEFVSGSDTVKTKYPDYAVKYASAYARDMANGAELAKRLSDPDCVDAALVFFDVPDAGGHGAFGGGGIGFYPHSTGYLRAISACDKMIGDFLAAISSRPAFDDEDWLIVITSDHGGYLTSHGMPGGHATSVPIFVVGKNIKHGRIPGTPSICSIAPTVLEHFNIDTSGISFDGKALGREVAARCVRPLKDALQVYLSFDNGKVENAAGGAVVAETLGKVSAKAKSGFIFGGLNIVSNTNTANAVRLKGSERFFISNDSEFTVALWVKPDEGNKGDPSIFSNKNWRSGRNPGLILTLGAKTSGARRPGVVFNSGKIDGGKRIDVGTFESISSQWTFYAVSRGSDGVLRVYQGAPDGTLYYVSENADKLNIVSNLPICIGQDGTCQYRHAFTGVIDEFSIWSRSVSHADIRRIFERNRKGLSLGDLLFSE